MNGNPDALAPIILLCTDATPFAEYLGEILCTEGLPWFERAGSWGDVQSVVGAANVLLMPHGAGADMPTVRAWLDAGGVVVAVRPPGDLVELAKLKALGDAASELPLRLSPPFDGGVARAHGDVDLYELSEDSVARVHAHVVHGGEEYPAVVSARWGQGQLVVFAYDLPRSIAFTRQGNPEWSTCRGTDMGSDTFRPVDLFVRGSGEQTWLDFPSAGVPVADLQQRLLAHLITSSSPRPIPRLWYLPHAKPTCISIVGDSDGADPEVVSGMFDDIAAVGGTMSAFLIDHTVDRTDKATVGRWRAAGHEVSVHPDYHLHGDASRPDAETMRLTQKTILDRFHSRFGFLPRTVRNHSISWVGFAGQPEVERSLGIRLNSSYTYSSAFGGPPYGGPAVGYLNGSGQPQKFADERGRVLDIYQLSAHVCDEMLKAQYLDFDGEKAWDATKELIDASLARWYSHIVLSFHPITYHRNPEAKRWLRDHALPYACEQRVPIWDTQHVLDFADARRGCRLENVEWADGRFRCEFHAPRGDMGLTLMLPGQVHARTLASLTVDGANVATSDTELAEGPWRLVVLERDQGEILATYD